MEAGRRQKDEDKGVAARVRGEDVMTGMLEWGPISWQFVMSDQCSK